LDALGDVEDYFKDDEPGVSNIWGRFGSCCLVWKGSVSARRNARRLNGAHLVLALIRPELADHLGLWRRYLAHPENIDTAFNNDPHAKTILSSSLTSLDAQWTSLLPGGRS
jgi:hypothetical protein